MLPKVSGWPAPTRSLADGHGVAVVGVENGVDELPKVSAAVWTMEGERMMPQNGV